MVLYIWGEGRLIYGGNRETPTEPKKRKPETLPIERIKPKGMREYSIKQAVLHFLVPILNPLGRHLASLPGHRRPDGNLGYHNSRLATIFFHNWQCNTPRISRYIMTFHLSTGRSASLKLQSNFSEATGSSVAS